MAVDVFGPDRANQLTEQESWGALEAALRHAERNGYDPATTLRSAEAQRELDTADDVPAVLSSRIEDVLKTRGMAAGYEATEPAVPRWVADPLPLSADSLPEEWREHLQERYDYLAARMQEQGESVAADQPAWSTGLGRIPEDDQRREQWTRLAAEVDTFRARYQVADDEENAIPERYRTNQVGQDLAARVTELHKSDELRRHAAERQAREKLEETGPQVDDREEEKVTAVARLDAWRREQAEQQRREEQQRQQGTWGPDQPGGPTQDRRGPRL